MADRGSLTRRLAGASGPDTTLDQEIAQAFGQAPAPFTASAEVARALVAAALPGWHLHVGFDVAGVLPYAALSKAGTHVEATAPTVPLAVLWAAAQALEAAD